MTTRNHESRPRARNPSTPARRAVAMLAALAGLTLGPGRAALAAGEAAGAAAAAPARIGQYASITGPRNSFGRDVVDGLALAIEEAAAAGTPLEVVVADDGGTPDGTREAVARLLSGPGIVAVVGEDASSLSLAGAPLCQRARIPMISPSSTNPRVTALGEFVFRVCFIDPVQGEAMAAFARDHLKARTAAILAEDASAYSGELATYFTTRFVASGGRVLRREVYRAGQTEFREALENLRQANPDVIYVPGYYSEVGLIARQAYDIGVTSVLLGGDGWDAPSLVEAGGPAIIGSFFTNHFHPGIDRPPVARFVEAFRDRFDRTPTGVSALAYDAGRLLVDAMARAGARAEPPGPESLRDELAATRDYEGVTGTITMGPDRNPVKPVHVLKVSAAGHEYVTTVAPGAGASPDPAPSGPPVGPGPGRAPRNLDPTGPDAP